MRIPQVVVYEQDGRQAAILRPLADRQAWSLREPRQVKACLGLLRKSEPGVLVIKLGRHLEREFALLQSSRRLAPATSVILVADTDHPALVGLGWDLGAAVVLTPPRSREALLEVVSALMEETDTTEGGQDGRTAAGR
jgi:DNA-binding response OmpR family regulator